MNGTKMDSAIAVVNPPKIPKTYKALFERATTGSLVEGDLEIKYYQWPGARTTLCLHGSNGNSAQFGKLISRLVSRGQGVVAVDIPSHDARGRFIPSNNIGHGLIALEKKCGEFHAAVAHSMACSWALWALKNGMHSRKVVCLSPAATQDYVFERFIALQTSSGISISELEEEISRSFGASWREKYSTINLCKSLLVDALIYHDLDDQVIEFEQGGKPLAQQWSGAVLRETIGLGHVGAFRNEKVMDEIALFVN